MHRLAEFTGSPYRQIPRTDQDARADLTTLSRNARSAVYKHSTFYFEEMIQQIILTARDSIVPVDEEFRSVIESVD